MDDRIAQRRKEVRRAEQLRRRRRTFVVAAVLLLIAALVVIERSPLVALARVEVSGLQRLSRDAVIDAAALPVGTSTVRLRLGGAQRRVEELALVRRAQLRRQGLRGVAIDIVEREPMLNVAGPDEPVLVDGDGIVIDLGQLEGLPVVVVDAPPPAVGSDVSEHPALANAVAAFNGLSGPLRSEVVRLEAAGPEQLDLVLGSGVVVRFGRAERLEEKVRALGAVLEEVADDPVAVIDVRAPSTPVVSR